MSDLGMTVGLIKALAPEPEVDPADITAAVDDWLDDHPEATTTVTDGSITKAKLNASLQGTVDDVDALKSAVNYDGESFGTQLKKDTYINVYGDETSGVGRLCSEYIPCPPYVKVTYVGENNHSGVYGLSFFDKDKVFLGGDKNNGSAKGTPTTVVSPEGTCYCRLSTDTSLVASGSYVQVDTIYKPFVWTNDRINSVEHSVDAMKKLGSALTPFEMPDGFSTESPVTVLTDGYHYTTDFNAENFKNTGGSTIYVSPLAGTSGNGTRGNPYRYAAAYSAAQDGDTIVLLPGIYSRAGQFFTEIKKSINVIGEGKATICLGDLTQFSLATGYDNVYVGQRSSGTYVFDVSNAPDQVIPLEAVESLANCAATKGSYYKDSSNYYVHPFKSGDPTGTLMIGVISTAEIPMSVSNSDQDVNVYIGNITIVGNPNGTAVNMASSTNDLTACYDNVKFILCGYGSENAFIVNGGNVVLHQCEVDGAYRDGFNYNGSNAHGLESRPCYVTEIDCKARNCGIGQTQEIMNCSTSHLGAVILRINGEYSDCLGPVVADVQDGTKSVNLGCKAYHSTASASGQCNGFQSANGTSTMWLYNCIAVGSSIDCNIGEGGAMILNQCSYGSKAEGVVSNDEVAITDWIVRHVAN